MSLRRSLYLLQRTMADVNAAKRGRLGERLIRRQVTRQLGRQYDKVWR